MSGITGYPSQEKLTTPLSGYSEQNSKTTSQFVTVSETHDKHVVQDVRINGAFRTTALVKTLTSVATDFPLRVLKCTAHGAVKGDFIRFESTAANPYFGAMVLDAPDADTLIIGSTLPVTPVLGDEFFVYKHVVPLYDEDGTLSVSSGPIRFIRDAVSTQVVEDTVDPSNNIPLPVKLTSVTGDINITAGDLNVQLSDTGPNPDITRIGDGTNRLVMTAAGEATTYDATAEAELIDINTELDSQTALLTTIDADTGAIATSTASIDGKLPATLGTKTAATSLAVTLASDEVLPLPTGAATEATLALIEGKDFATETTLQSIGGDVSTIVSPIVNTEAELMYLNGIVATEATTTAILTNAGILSSAIGTVGIASPSTMFMIGGKEGGTSYHVNVNSSGEVLTRNNGIPNSLGQDVASGSTSVVLASDQSPINVRSGLVPREYDQIDLTYVTVGNGIGEVETAVYKLATVTVATLTLSYDSSNRLASVVRT